MRKTVQIGIVVASVGLASTLAVLTLVSNANRVSDQQRLERLAERVEAELGYRLTQYDLALHAVRGLFGSSDQVESHEFKSMVDSFVADVELPGYDHFGYIQSFAAEHDPNDLLAGTDDRTSTTPAPSAPYKHALRYCNGNQPFSKLDGDELVLTASQQHTLNRSAKSGNTVALIENSELSSKLLFFTPIYEKQDRTVLQGYVFLAVNGQSLSNLNRNTNEEICFTINCQPELSNDGSSFTIGSHLKPHTKDISVRQQRTLNACGTNWTLRIEPSESFAHTDSVLAGVVLIGGIACSILIASIIFVLRADASRAKVLASTMLNDLRRLAMVAERTTNAVVLTDEHRRIVWVNDGFTRLTGYSMAEVLGKSPGSFLQFEKTSPETVHRLHEALNKNEGFCGEILNRDKNGREYWVSIDVQPLFNDDGIHIGFLAIENDITAMKQTTQELAEAREQTEFALDGGKLSIWQWNLDSNTMFFDQRFYQITRYVPRTGPQDGQFWLNRIHPDDMDQFNSIVEECASGSRSYFENQFRLLAEDGTYLWLMARGRAAGKDEFGSVNQLMGTLVEITARKLAEEALRESEAKTSAIFNSSIDAIMLMNELKIIDCNQPAVSLFGFNSKEELQGVHITDLTPEIQSSGRHTQQLLSEINETVAQCGHAKFEWTHLKRDGAKFEVDVSYSDLEIAGKAMQLAIVRDISKKKELERQLSQAQKLESIGQLSAGIAHEVNTPMQCVFSNVEYLHSSLAKIYSLIDAYRDTLNKAGLEDKWYLPIQAAEKNCRYDDLRTDCMDAVVESAEASKRVIEIVRAMKTMSHPGTTELSPTDLNKLIRDASIISRNRWKYVAKFEVELDESISDVPLLPAQMSQVILNLIVNSADAIAEKIGCEPAVLGMIKAKTYRGDQGVFVEISDSGIGMCDKTKERVFDPFFTTKEVGKGTGQGLAIAYDVIVRQHLGRISVDSVPGCGSTFRVWLPCQPSSILAPQTVTSSIVTSPAISLA